MKNFRNFSKKLLKNKRGQGATEYILLLVVVVAVVLMFKGKIMAAMSGQLDTLNTQMSAVSQ